MSPVAQGPQGQRRGRGARERILDTARHLFRVQGINSTGMDQLSADAGVSKRTVYQHFDSKDRLVAECLRGQDLDARPGPFYRTDLAPRDQLLAVFEVPDASTPTPLCPFIGAAVEIADPEHPARAVALSYKRSVAERLTEIARAAGADDPQLLGEQLALLLDGASTRTRALGSETLPTAAGIAAVLVARAVPAAPGRRARTQSRSRGGHGRT